MRKNTRIRYGAVLVFCATAPLGIAQAVAPTDPIPGITLTQAIERAQSADTAYASAVADAGITANDRGIAGAALLPGIVYHNQYLYTQPLHVNGKPVPDSSTPRFIANNGIHEYVSQAVVTETIGGSGLADYGKARADAAAARARLEVARRGLVSTVVAGYYGVLTADAKLAVMQRALDEATHFGKISSQLEQGGEVAHADTIKANLQLQQRQRDLGDAKLAAEKARLDLGVLLFPDPRIPYTLTADLTAPAPELPQREQINAAAKNYSPDLRAAIEAFHSANLELVSSRLSYLPSLTLNYNYGIDAAQFATHAPDGSRNLGYSASATLDIPVWDWFTTRDKIRQSSIRRNLARVELTNTQRQLVASLEELYSEAEEAHTQLMTLDDSVRDARESLRLTNLRYSSGEAPALEVVDAQNTLIATESSRADGAARYYTALANLQTLTGNMP
jgi:outer membrane protein TolC